MYILYKPTSQKEVKHPFNYENRSAILPIKQSYPFEMKKKKKKKKKKQQQTNISFVFTRRKVWIGKHENVPCVNLFPLKQYLNS